MTRLAQEFGYHRRQPAISCGGSSNWRARQKRRPPVPPRCRPASHRQCPARRLTSCTGGTTPGPWFVSRKQWLSADRGLGWIEGTEDHEH
jgi:hypothetical protein